LLICDMGNAKTRLMDKLTVAHALFVYVRSETSF
jgi:hypothetical protein